MGDELNLDGLAAAGDANLAATWAALGRAAGFPVDGHGSIVLTASGLPIAFFNGAFVGAPVADADADAALGAVLAFFEPKHVPYLVWGRASTAARLLGAGRAAGLRDAGGPPSMVLPAIGDAPAPPPELTLRLATDASDLVDVRRVLAGGFGMPPEVADHVVTDALLDDPSLATVVGRVDGEAVTTALVSCTGSTAGIYNVATLADHRGKGYGEASTWAAVIEGGRRGCSHSILQASEAGEPVYRRMGFVVVDRYVQLEGPPAATS